MTVPPTPSDPHRSDEPRPGAASSRADGRPAWYPDDAPGAASPAGQPHGSTAAGWPDTSPAAPYGQPRSSATPAPGGWPGGPAYGAAPVYGGVPLGPGQESGTGLAVASLILGIFSLLGGAFLVLPPIVGAVLGHLSRRREPNGRGMALAGLITNYVALVLLALGIALFVILLAVGLAADPGAAPGGTGGGLNA